MEVLQSWLRERKAWDSRGLLTAMQVWTKIPFLARLSASGWRWQQGRGEQVSHHASQTSCSRHRLGVVTVLRCAWAACPKAVPQTPVLPPCLSVLPPSSSGTARWQTPSAALTGTVALAGTQCGSKLGEVEPCQLQHRQLLVAGVGFQKVKHATLQQNLQGMRYCCPFQT